MPDANADMSIADAAQASEPAKASGDAPSLHGLPAPGDEGGSAAYAEFGAAVAEAGEVPDALNRDLVKMVQNGLPADAEKAVTLMQEVLAKDPEAFKTFDEELQSFYGAFQGKARSRLGFDPDPSAFEKQRKRRDAWLAGREAAAGRYMSNAAFKKGIEDFSGVLTGVDRLLGAGRKPGPRSKAAGVMLENNPLSRGGRDMAETAKQLRAFAKERFPTMGYDDAQALESVRKLVDLAKFAGGAGAPGASAKVGAAAMAAFGAADKTAGRVLAKGGSRKDATDEAWKTLVIHIGLPKAGKQSTRALIERYFSKRSEGVENAVESLTGKMAEEINKKREKGSERKEREGE